MQRCTHLHTCPYGGGGVCVFTVKDSDEPAEVSRVPTWQPAEAERNPERPAGSSKGFRQESGLSRSVFEPVSFGAVT